MENVAEIIELVKNLNDEELKAYRDYLERLKKMTPTERKEFNNRIMKRLDELNAQET